MKSNRCPYWDCKNRTEFGCCKTTACINPKYSHSTYILETNNEAQARMAEAAALNKLADYEDAEEQGRVVVLPCKVGDTIYEHDAERIYEHTVRNIIFDTATIAFDESAIGKTVFLTREEAEKALEGMNNG